MSMKSFAFIKDGGWLTMTIAVVLGVMLVVGFVQAATTISTNVDTGGTLNVTGLSTLTNASTTILSTTGNFMVNGFATTTASSGNFATAGTLTVVGASTFTGAVTAASSVTIAGTASTSALMVGDEPAAPTINGMVFGYCSFTDVTLAASSTAGFASCTTVPALALVAGDRVFVQATSSFESQYVITAASTTGVSTIQLRILNTGLGAADGTLSGTSINFWALR